MLRMYAFYTHQSKLPPKKMLAGGRKIAEVGEKSRTMALKRTFGRVTVLTLM
jgi:hypothetical protein